MQVNITIVSGSAADRDRLSIQIHSYFEDRRGMELLLGIYSDEEELLRDFRPGLVHILFIDTRMKGVGGVELARRLRVTDSRLMIVFISGSAKPALDAYQVHPFDFLIKPWSAQRLNTILDELLHTLKNSAPLIMLHIVRGHINLPVSHIVSAVSHGHNVMVHTVGGRTLRCLMSFREIDSILKKYPCFLLCNRGILVNMDHALFLDDGEIGMEDGSSFNLRVRKRRELVFRYSQYKNHRAV